jgi:hypothetical protein
VRASAEPACGDDLLSLREARARYFRANGFGADGGYAASWVKVRLGPIPLAFPNTAARVRAVRFHDLHHVVTGYATDVVGEAEIAAWEIASGCAGFAAAWVLNLHALVLGLLRAPRATWRAFVRGRRTRNLYRWPYDEGLLGARVGDVRARLGLGAASPSAAGPATWGDRVAFAAWSANALLLSGAWLALLMAPLWLGVRALL